MSHPPTPEALLEHADWVAALAARLVSDPAQADDLVQATWLEALKSRPGEIRNPRAWLGAVVRNAARQWRRGEDRRRRREEHAAENVEWPSAAELVERANLQREVVGRVVDLDEPYRTTVLLRFFEGLPQREIAARMDCPVTTVNTRLQRGLAKLRERLDDDYGDRSTWSTALIPLLAIVGPRAARLALPWGALAAYVGTAVLVGGTVCGGVAATRAWGGREGARLAAIPPAPAAPADEAPAVLVMPTEADLEEADELVPQRSVFGPEERRVTRWLQLHGGPAHANYRARRDAIVFPRLLWHVPGAAGQPAVSGEDVYTVGAGLQRIDARTGRVLAWQAADERTGRPATASRQAEEESGAEPGEATELAFVGAPAVAADAVIVRRSDGAVVAWDRTLVRQLWSRPLDPPTDGEARPGVLADDVYVCGSAGTVVGLARSSGTILWTWRLEAGDSVQVTPAVAEGRVLFGTQRGFAIALDVETGALGWRRRVVPGLVGADPVAVDGLVLLADRGVRGERRGALHALAIEDGEPAWSYVYGSMDLATPGVGDGELLAHAAREVVALDLSTGEPAAKPEQRTGRPSGSAPLLVGSTLFSADREGFLYAHSREREELAWALLVPGGSIDRFACVDERLYVTTTDGLYAIGDDPEAGRLPRGYVLRVDGR